MIRNSYEIYGCRCTFSNSHSTGRHRKLAGVNYFIVYFMGRVGFKNMTLEG